MFWIMNLSDTILESNINSLDDSESSGDGLEMNPILRALLQFGIGFDEGDYHKNSLMLNQDSYDDSYDDSYEEVYLADQEVCEICNKNFDDVKKEFNQLRDSHRSWKECPSCVTFRLYEKVVCIFCVNKEKGLECPTCKLKYFYTDCFYPNQECKACYTNSKKGCHICYGYLDELDKTRTLCQVCEHDVKRIHTHNKKCIVDRELFIYRKKNKKKKKKD